MLGVEKTNAYAVFRRVPDGYVDATAVSAEFSTSAWEPIPVLENEKWEKIKERAHKRLAPHVGGNGKRWSYEILLITLDWPEARNLIEKLRNELDYPKFDWENDD